MLFETRTNDQRHHIPRQSLVFTHAVDRDDVRVAQPRDCLRFTAESLAHRGVDGKLGTQHLHRDVALKPYLEGGVDRRESSAPKQTANLVAVAKRIRESRLQVVISIKGRHREGRSYGTVRLGATGRLNRRATS